MARTETKSSPLLIAASWLIVLIPLGWGVVQSVVKSLPLFQMPPASEEPPPSTENERVIPIGMTPLEPRARKSDDPGWTPQQRHSGPDRSEG